MDLSTKSLIKRLKADQNLLKTGGIVKKRFNFSPVSNTVIDDSTIPIETRGLYVIIQRWITYYDNSHLDKEFLRKKANVGIDKFERMWKELKTFGYLKQYRITSGKGSFIYIYELLDEPDLTNVATVNVSMKDLKEVLGESD